MKFVSLFSGIGGFDLGLERAGMECIAQVEFDKKCQETLDKHWPNVERFDDVREVTGAEFGEFDLICGGYPCQDLSVAGLRAGLAGERSGLFREFMRIVAATTPKWVLIENVPGLLSSNRGRDMGVNVTTLAELGYGWAYRVLDAQNFGVAQRRRRVFIVGCLGDARSAAEVLFDSESGAGNPPPRRATKQDVAYTVGRSAKADRGESANLVTEAIAVKVAQTNANGTNVSEDGVAYTLDHTQQAVAHEGSDSGCLTPYPEIGEAQRVYSEEGVSPALKSHGVLVGQDDPETGPSMTLTASAAKGVAEDGTGRGCPIVVTSGSNPTVDEDRSGPVKSDGAGQTTEEFVMAFAQNQRDEVRDLGEASGALAAQPGMKQQTFIAVGITNDPTVKIEEERTGALRENGPSGSRMIAAYDAEAIEARRDAPEPSEEIVEAPEVAATLSTANGKRDGGRRQEDDVNLAVVAAFSAGQGAKAGGIGYDEEVSPTLKAGNSGTNQTPRVLVEGEDEPFPTLRGFGHGWQGQHNDDAARAMMVRRLTPVECERLQGFPDGWTEGHSDTARYKQLGNAVCVPVAAWIGKRMMEVHGC